MNADRAYYRIMLGAKSAFAQQCHDEKWFGGGCIIALADDLKLRRALRATANIDFYRYKVSFKLFKA
jgi:hypothetical protein